MGSLSRGISVQGGVSLQRDFSPGRLVHGVSGGFCPGGSLLGHLCPGVSVQEGLYLGVSILGHLCPGVGSRVQGGVFLWGSLYG